MSTGPAVLTMRIAASDNRTQYDRVAIALHWATVALVLVIPAESEFEIVEMSEEEEAERELQARRIHESRRTLSADTEWTSASSTVFDGTYRHMLRAAKAKAAGKPSRRA